MTDLREPMPMIVPGLLIQLSGHPARVVKIAREGVQVQIGNRLHIVPFNQIETSIKKN